MTEPVDPARSRYFLMTGANLMATAGAVLGLVIAGRAQAVELRVLGGALIIASLLVMATLPRWLARRWRTPRDE